MNKKLVQEIKNLPKKPGVYLYRNEKETVIYVGKAINLRNRVNSYFQGKKLDPKTKRLVANIKSLETIECESEIEALILESELIKRYRPKYNFEWKDDKNYCFIRITKDDYPKVEVTRQITDPKSDYFGPFVDSVAVRASLKTLRHIFPYCTCRLSPDKVCLYFHLGLCPGHGPNYISSGLYRKNTNQLKDFLLGKKENIIKTLEKQMKAEARNQEYEKAASSRNKLIELGKIKYTHILSEKRNLGLEKALLGLKNDLNLKSIPQRIECYDISNISGKHAVGSMVVFTNGVPQKSHYRRFEIKTVKKIDDFGMLREVITRRFSGRGSSKKDVSFKETPDLVVIDGGKGQLSASIKILQNLGQNVAIIGLAKRLEEVYSLNDDGQFKKTIFQNNSESKFLLQRIRDEAHRFAITYHRNLRSRDITSSVLEGISGIGPKTRKKLINRFGSIEGIKKAKPEEISQVVGIKLTEKLLKEL